MDQLIFPQERRRILADTATKRDVKLADDEAELARVVQNLIKIPPESRRQKNDGGRNPRQDNK